MQIIQRRPSRCVSGRRRLRKLSRCGFRGSTPFPSWSCSIFRYSVRREAEGRRAAALAGASGRAGPRGRRPIFGRTERDVSRSPLVGRRRRLSWSRQPPSTTDVRSTDSLTPAHPPRMSKPPARFLRTLGVACGHVSRTFDEFDALRGGPEAVSVIR
jgi:hypothetical protein